jgi:hypothetical protein
MAGSAILFHEPRQNFEITSETGRPCGLFALRRVMLGAAFLVAIACSDASAATFTVTNANSSGAGSLAQAITSANATAAADVIQFNTLGLGVTSIAGTLPAITQPLTIDGYSRLFSSDNNRTDAATNANILVELDGSGLADGSTILDIQSNLTTIRGLAIKNIPPNGNGIRVATGTSKVAILGCFIGTNAAGLLDLSNGTGILAEGSAIIGTTDPGDRNLLIGNRNAIEIRGTATRVDNNTIGLDSDGGTGTANQVGVMFSNDASDNLIGVLQRNFIAGNTSTGIAAFNDSGQGNRFARNNIYDNGELGIDLGNPGPDVNDDGDADAGPNGLQNSPDLNFVRYNQLDLNFRGTLRSKPGDYRVYFYKSTAPDPSGFGEGEKWRDGLDVTIAPGQTTAKFEITYTNTAKSGTEYFTATAEEIATGNTSEFSHAVEAIEGGFKYVVTNTADDGYGSLRVGTYLANEGNEAYTILFDIPGDGPHTIVAPTALSLINGGTTIIDGYSQPGSSVNTLSEGSNANLRIVLTTGGDNAILNIDNSTAIIQGLAIHSGAGHGISIVNSEDDQILGNFIGTDVTGTVDLGNAGMGVDIDLSSNVTVGGPVPAHRNVISGNGQGGVSDFGVTDTVINNLIGFSKNLQPLGNAGRGVYSGSDSSIVGSDEPGLANRIGYNTGQGIEVVSVGKSVGIRGNSIGHNTELGIDLRNGGPSGVVTPNDVNDLDDGPNAFQNFPVLTSLEIFPESFVLKGTLDVNPAVLDPNYTIRVYASSQCDPSGHGEGERFLAAFKVAIDKNLETFQDVISATLAPGEFVTATASDSFERTSEFSACIANPTEAPLCGDATGNDKIAAGDALIVLRTAVGTVSCALCVCDVNSSGSVTSSDALLVLRSAVGQSVSLSCPGC